MGWLQEESGGNARGPSGIARSAAATAAALALCMGLAACGTQEAPGSAAAEGQGGDAAEEVEYTPIGGSEDEAVVEGPVEVTGYDTLEAAAQELLAAVEPDTMASYRVNAESIVAERMVNGGIEMSGELMPVEGDAMPMSFTMKTASDGSLVNYAVGNPFE